MNRVKYEVTYADGTTAVCAAPAGAPKHEVRKAFVKNNAEEVKAHGGIKKFSEVLRYNYWSIC